MSTVASLVAKLGLDNAEYQEKLKQSATQAKEFSDKTKSFLRDSLSFATGGAILNGLTSVAGGIKGIADGMVGGNAKFETYNQQFGVMLKSATLAKQRLADLAVFGAKTPFELPQVVEADRVLQGFGLHSEEAAKKFGFSGAEIRTIAGDVASGTGASFKDMSLLIGKFSAGATGEAISRMQELGITNRDELKKMGIQFSKSGELTSPLPQAMNVVLGLMKEKYGGLMDAQSSTFEGMVSNLEDWKAGTLRTIGEPIFDVLKNNLKTLLDVLNGPQAQAAVKGFASGMASMVKNAIEIARVIADNAKPAIIGLTAAGVTYALSLTGTLIPAMMATATQAVTMGATMLATVGPLVAVGVAVYGVVKAYSAFKDATSSAADQILAQRKWWTDSTAAIEAYAKAGDKAKIAARDQAAALDELRNIQRSAIATYVAHTAAYAQFGVASGQSAASLEKERLAINARDGAIVQATKDLNDHIRLYDGIDERAQAIQELRDAHGGYAQAIKLSDDELKKLFKDLEKIQDEGAGVLGKAVQNRASFLKQIEDMHLDHSANLRKINVDGNVELNKLISEYESEYARLAKEGQQDRLTELTKNYQEQRNALIANYSEKAQVEKDGFVSSEQQAAIAYAKEQAAQMQHLGTMLLNYVNNQVSMHNIAADRGAMLTDAIAKNYGVQRSEAEIGFAAQIAAIDAWAQGTDKSTASVIASLQATTNSAATMQLAMDQAIKDRTMQITEDFNQHRINADQYVDALAKIPTQVKTMLELEMSGTAFADLWGTLTPEQQLNFGTSGLPGRAVGGPVNAGTSYMVGERGPETFVPAVSGSIVPTGGVAGMPVVHVTVQGSVITERDLAEKIRSEIVRTGKRNGSTGL